MIYLEQNAVAKLPLTWFPVSPSGPWCRGTFHRGPRNPAAFLESVPIYKPQTVWLRCSHWAYLTKPATILKRHIRIKKGVHCAIASIVYRHGTAKLSSMLKIVRPLKGYATRLRRCRPHYVPNFQS